MSKFTSFTKLFDFNFRNHDKVSAECYPQELEFSRGDAIRLKGRAVVAYLRRRKLDDKGEPLVPVVHFTCCKTIQDNPNKFYCTSFDKSNKGEFWIDAIDDERVVIEDKSGLKTLKACQNCLSDLCAIPRYDKKLEELSSNFDFNGFLDSDYLLNPRIWHSIDNTNLKSGEWKAISKEIRSQANWVCDSCKVSFEREELRPFLHTHHINNNSAFNHAVNLRALCIECHAEQPNHGHMKENNLQYKTYMERKHELLRVDS